MDPLTALGLAAGVVQFVGFASHLVSRTKEISASASGQTKEIATVEATYTTLQDLSLRLEASAKRDPRLEVVEGKTDFVKHVFAINDLSRICASDCQKLLDIVGKLKASGDGLHRRWQALRAAFKTVYKGNEMAELEERLHHTQMTLTLHVCSLTNFWHASFNRQLKQLRSESMELNAQQSTKLGDIARTLDELSARITSARMTAVPDAFDSDDIACIENQMTRLSLSKSAAARENTILRSLSFDSRPVRHSSIPDASQRTFDWAFQQASHRGNALATSYLLKWLREGEGFFWVTGKPGSGKSTFMKYVADNPITLSALAQWSYPKRPVLASHYFWSAGTPLQKSQQGLLQTLLYDIFCQLPDLIETVCAERWLKTIEELSHESWSLSELQRTLQRIADLRNIPTKFCFFIDGLDEFGGDHVDFCQSLHRLGQSPHVKICVSSRPWNVFEDSFGRDNDESKLYIHELTRNDIRTYAQQRLQDHPRWKEFDGEIAGGTWIIDEITERASGVFLWVLLVTKELRSGLSEYDSFSDMQKRLDSIPVHLEAFFKHILQSVEAFYHQKMATTLQLSLAATEPAPVAVYGFLDDERDDENYALKLPLQALKVDQAASRRKLMTHRLNGRCRGLLDVNRHSNRVEFLHRSVMDFLRTAEMSDFLTNKSPPDFNARVSLIRAYTAYIKTTEFPEFVDRTCFNQHTASRLMQAIREILTQAEEIQGEMEDISYPLLNELDRCIPEMHMSGQAALNVWGNPSNPVTLFFREPVVASGLTGYLGHILPGHPDYFADFEKPVLSYLVDSLSKEPLSTAQIRRKTRMVRCLLENGCDPNAIYYDPTDITYRQMTPWIDYITQSRLKLINNRDPKTMISAEQAIMKELPSLMLQHGADPALVGLSGTPEQPYDNLLHANSVSRKRSTAPYTYEELERADKRFKQAGS